MRQALIGLFLTFLHVAAVAQTEVQAKATAAANTNETENKVECVKRKGWIEADDSDTSLVVTGRFEVGKDLVGNLRLTAQGGDVTDFKVLPSDLTGDADQPTVGRQNVTLVPPHNLENGVPKDFRVKVGGLQKPGTYRGQILLLSPGWRMSKAVEIKLQVTATPVPKVTLFEGGESLKMNLVNCDTWVDCRLAEFLLPRSALDESWQIYLDNQSKAEIAVVKATVVVKGEKNGTQLTNQNLVGPDLPRGLAADKGLVAFPLTVKRKQIPPDHFIGGIYLSFAGSDEKLKVPVDLNVRAGPLWALVILFLGIVLGRVVKFMQERGGPQADALTRVNRLQYDLNRAHADDRGILQPQLDEVRRAVYRERLETVTTRLDTVRSRLTVLEELRRIEASLKGKQHPLINGIEQKIERARDNISLKQDVKDLMEEIAKDLAQLRTTLTKKGELVDPQITAAGEAAESGRVAATQAAPVELPAAETGRKVWARNTLAALTGLSDEIRAEATLWLVRPLLYLFLLVMLALVGLNTFYIVGGTTFGAAPLADYLSVLLWGLSADVASRTLSNLQGTKSK